MTTATHPDAGFLAAILAAPDDDLVRLVYADALEERGDPRGEFIRVQIRIANGEAFGLLQEFSKLRGRERELLKEHERLWVPHLLNSVDFTVEVEFTRGFVSSVTVPSIAAFMGSSCVRCVGRGRIRRQTIRHLKGGIGGPGWSTSDPKFSTSECPDCHGTGTLPGIGRELARLCPLERVLTDRKPSHWQQWYSWFRGHRDGRDEPFSIPVEIWDLLTKCQRHGNWADYPTAAAAEADLSQAMLAAVHPTTNRKDERDAPDKERAGAD